MSPTARSLKHLRDAGCLADVTERWLPQARVRKDLFGCIDLLALTEGGQTIAVQTTSGSNVSARVKKLTESESLPWMRRAGWAVVIHGWRKNAAGRWVLREVDLS